MPHLRSKPRIAFTLVCLLVLGWPASLPAQTTTPATPSSLAAEAEHGVRIANMDLSVEPGQDFYRYATGGWADQSEIPPDEALYGAWEEVIDLTRQQLIGLLDDLADSDQLPVGSDHWKAVQLFNQAMDMKTRNALGIAPIEGELTKIDAIASRDDFYALLRDEALSGPIYGLFSWWVWADYADSSVYSAWYGGPWLGLPNRDYYWEDDEGNEEIREAYRAMSAKLLQQVGYDAPRATEAADRVFAFEKRLAEPILRPEDWNDPQKYYHPRPVADLIAANPDFDWPGILEVLGIPDLAAIVVTEEDYLAAVEGIVRDTDLETLKDYLKLQVLAATSGALSEDIEDIAFDFYQTALNGVEEKRPLPERALGEVNDNLGFALGQLYVAAYFPPEAKRQMEELVQNEIAAMRVRIENLDWMTPATKEAALAKLDKLRVKVAYPDEWRTYENVSIEESLTQTLRSASIAESNRWLARIGQPVDRAEWFALPQEVNAYYDPSNNEIIFPAAILQPPYFDYQADPASNYGAIGMIIGHEITHGFDQGGAQFDGDGNLAEWWTEADHSQFEALTDELSAQYDAIEVLPEVYVDGDLTIGENIADLGGIQIAYDALRIALQEDGDPGPIDGLSQDQRFFLATAFVWSEEVREEYLRTQVQTDFHAPEQVRGVQPARNTDVFHESFGIEPGDPMYLPPDQRIVIW